jgi:hypothetical protein
MGGKPAISPWVGVSLLAKARSKWGNRNGKEEQSKLFFPTGGMQTTAQPFSIQTLIRFLHFSV